MTDRRRATPGLNRRRTTPGPDVRRTGKQAPGSNGGGMPCPQCGERIEITIEALLVRRSFACQAPGCGTVLHLDRRASSEAIDALKLLKLRVDELGIQN